MCRIKPGTFHEFTAERLPVELKPGCLDRIQFGGEGDDLPEQCFDLRKMLCRNKGLYVVKGEEILVRHKEKPEMDPDAFPGGAMIVQTVCDPCRNEDDRGDRAGDSFLILKVKRNAGSLRHRRRDTAQMKRHFPPERGVSFRDRCHVPDDEFEMQWAGGPLFPAVSVLCETEKIVFSQIIHGKSKIWYCFFQNLQ